MPDITMCSDRDCPMATKCYRSDLVTEANPQWQSYFCESPRRCETCEMFDPMDGSSSRSRCGRSPSRRGKGRRDEDH